MKISATDPLTPAWDRMVRICFKPFSFDKWLALGFCAWLAFLLDGGASFNIPTWPGGFGGGDSGWGEDGEEPDLEALEELLGGGGGRAHEVEQGDQGDQDELGGEIGAEEPEDSAGEEWQEDEPEETWDGAEEPEQALDGLEQELARELKDELSDDTIGGLIERAPEELRKHLGLIITVAVVSFVIGLAIVLVLLWISSRGHFMFIDGIVADRGAVVEPWGRLREQGNSLFRARLLLGVIFGGAVLLLLGIAAYGTLPKVMRNEFGLKDVGGLVAMGLVVLGVVLLSLLVTALLDNLVVPTMYARGCGALEAWRVVRQDLLPGHLGDVVLFFLLKIGLAIGAGMVTGIVVLLTCCLAALPYVGTVVLLPLLVFIRGYSLHFVDQFGGGFKLFAEPVAPEAEAPALD